MDARKFFPVADRLRNSDDEADRRTSIGRSYYGLFHVLLSALSEGGVIFRKTPEDHQTLISYLTKSGHVAARSVGNTLKDLRDYRNRADYKLKKFIDKKTTDFVYEKAIRALSQFETIPAPELAALIRTIQNLP